MTIPTPCAACGDPARATWQGRDYCADCVRELRDGVIPRGTVSFVGGGHPECVLSENRYHGTRGFLPRRKEAR